MKSKEKVRIEIHLTPAENKKLEDIAAVQGRSRKGEAEYQIRCAIKKLHSIIVLCGCIILFGIGCKKKETAYAIRFEINGKSSYTYQVGSVNKSGSTASSVTINEVAHDGDYVKCVATADSAKLVKLEYYRDNRLKGAQNNSVAEEGEQL